MAFHLINAELAADVDVGEEAVKDASGTGRVHAHENVSDHVRDDEYNDEWADWRVDIFHELVVAEIKKDVGDDHVQDADKELTD